MNKILLIIILFCNGILFSQKTKIDKDIITPGDIDFKGCVKKITLESFELNKKADKIDTVKTISEIYFSKLGKILNVKKYDKSFNDLWSIIEYDDLGRIKTISRRDGDKMFNSVNQYFKTNSEYPDSTTIYSDEKYREKYINHFKNNLVIKQEHFVNGSLQDYRIYKYNDKNQLIEDLYLNPENNSDETVIYKSDNQMSFYPEILTLYEYKKIKDTLISIKIRPKYNLKEVTKKIINNKFSLEIKDDYDKDYLKNSRFIYTYKDSINAFSYYYKNKKEIKDYYKTSSTEKSITSRWKNEGYGNNQERSETIKIDIVYDKFKNWIRKTYSKENLTTRIIKREIEYHWKEK